LARKLGQLQPFVAVFPQECVGRLASAGQPNTFLTIVTPMRGRRKNRTQLPRSHEFYLFRHPLTGVAIGFIPKETWLMLKLGIITTRTSSADSGTNGPFRCRGR
jgi:hypothetical protein